MPKSKRELREVLPALKRGEERSTLFWWMLDQIDELVAAANGRRPRWGQLCERFASLDLKDGRGCLPSPEAARRTWRHVRLYAASQEAAKLPKRSKPPSRMSPDWRPEVVPVAVQPGAAVPALRGQSGLVPARGSSLAALEEDPAAKARADAMMDNVMQQLLDMDRKTFGP
jgi:hypothetical protein